MNKKSKIVLLSTVIILVTVLAGTGIALAKNVMESNRLNESSASLFLDLHGKNVVSDTNAPEKRGMRGNVGIGIRRDVTLRRLATLLGITSDEIKTQLSSGKSLLDIATSKGKTAKDVVDTILAPFKEHLQVSIKYGYISQADADATYQLRSSRTEARISRAAQQKTAVSWSFQPGRNGGYRGSAMSGRYTPSVNMKRGYFQGEIGRGIPQDGIRRGFPPDRVNSSR